MVTDSNFENKEKQPPYSDFTFNLTRIIAITKSQFIKRNSLFLSLFTFLFIHLFIK